MIRSGQRATAWPHVFALFSFALLIILAIDLAFDDVLCSVHIVFEDLESAGEQNQEGDNANGETDPANDMRASHSASKRRGFHDFIDGGQKPALTSSTQNAELREEGG
jgi:hypothetical protein